MIPLPSIFVSKELESVSTFPHSMMLHVKRVPLFGRHSPKQSERQTQSVFSFSQKLAVIQAAILVLDKVNPHRFIHLNVYKVDPVAKLRKFEREISRSTTNFEFHERMTAIFRSMNDFHTVYRRPAPLNLIAAVIGFQSRSFSRREVASQDTLSMISPLSTYPMIGNLTSVLKYCQLMV